MPGTLIFFLYFGILNRLVLCVCSGVRVCVFLFSLLIYKNLARVKVSIIAIVLERLPSM